MKIKKIKSDGQYIYPATIAAAVKDANFLKQDDSPMTLGEINLYLNNRLDESGVILDRASAENIIMTSTQSGNVVNSLDYFIKATPDNCLKPMLVHFKGYASPYNTELTNNVRFLYGLYDIYVTVLNGAARYMLYSDFPNGSYKAFQNLVVFGAKEAEFKNFSDVYIGITIRGAASPNDPSYARNLTVELISVEGGSAELLKNENGSLRFTSLSELGFASVPSTYFRSDFGDLGALGLKHSGDNNTTYSAVNYEYWHKVKLASQAITNTQLFGVLADGTIAPLLATSGTATTKKANTLGFNLDTEGIYWSLTATPIDTYKNFNHGYKQFEFDCRNATNTTFTTGLKSYLIFIKGSDGLFYLNNPTVTTGSTLTEGWWYKCTDLPKTVEEAGYTNLDLKGLYFFEIGYLGNANTVRFYSDNPIYYYKEGVLTQYIRNATNLSLEDIDAVHYNAAWVGTKELYDALEEKDPNMVYLIKPNLD